MSLPLTIRKEIVDWLRAAAPLATLPADRIYGEQSPAVPVWPFSRYGLPSWQEWEDSIGTGVTGPLMIHAFADGPGTDKIHLIASAIEDRLRLFIPVAFEILECDWVRTNILRDGAEAGKFHAVVEFRLTARE